MNLEANDLTFKFPSTQRRARRPKTIHFGIPESEPYCQI